MQLDDPEITARSFLKKHNLTIPITLKKVADILGSKIEYTDINTDSATLYKGDYKDLIIVSSNQSQVEQRLNIANLIAHTLLNHQGQIFISNMSDKSNKSLEEEQAIICANELLIPTLALKEEARRCNYNLNKLAKLFKVTKQAILNKLE